MRAEVVLCGFRMPLIQRHLVKRRQGSKIVLVNPKIECTSFPADGTVTNAGMVDVCIDFETDPAAMAGSPVSLLHLFTFLIQGLFGTLASRLLIV